MYKKIALTVVFLLCIAGLIGLAPGSPFSDGLVRHLRGMTTAEDVIPAGSSFDVVYVLGGSQSSLQEKYARLGSLCRTIRYKTILILDRPGITEYSSRVGRNLTNNEWSLMQLERLGIKRQDVELLSMHEGYFGTLSEARAVAGWMEEQGYRTALLVTAPHHTERVKRSFERMIGNSGMRCSVTGSAEEAAVRELLMENLKLAVYTCILLPMED